MTELSLGLTSTTLIRTWVDACIRVHYDKTRDQLGAASGLGYFAKFAASVGKPFAGNIDSKLIADYRLALQNRGLSPSTINTRLSQVSALLGFMGQHNMTLRKRFEAIKMKYVNRPKNKRKWHLTDEQDVALGELLGKLINEAATAKERETWRMMDDYFDWATETGLRVEETLRLLPSDFRDLSGDFSNAGLIVPGTKTDESEAYIPLSKMAATVAADRINWNATRFDLLDARAKPPERRLFDISYRTLHRRFDDLKGWLGWPADATLKGLRRTFAGRALRKGLDIRLIQEIMRHTSEDTTREYLKLFGMANNPETRAKLNQQVVNHTRPNRQTVHTSFAHPDDVYGKGKHGMGGDPEPAIADDYATFEKVNDTTVRSTKAGIVDFENVMRAMFPGARVIVADEGGDILSQLDAIFKDMQTTPSPDGLVHWDGTERGVDAVTCPSCLHRLKLAGLVRNHG